MREDFKNICWKNVKRNFCFFAFIFVSLFLFVMSGRNVILDFPFIIHLSVYLRPGEILIFELVPFRNLYLELTSPQYMHHIQYNISKIALAACFNLLFMLKFKNKAEAVIYSLIFYFVGEFSRLTLLTLTPLAFHFIYVFNIDNLIYYIAGIFISFGIIKAFPKLYRRMRKRDIHAN